jgi:hypothetical protein
MADRSALRFVGFVYGAVAAAVTLTAFVMVLRDIQAGVVTDATAPRPAIARAG